MSIPYGSIMSQLRQRQVDIAVERQRREQQKAAMTQQLITLGAMAVGAGLGAIPALGMVGAGNATMGTALTGAGIGQAAGGLIGGAVTGQLDPMGALSGGLGLASGIYNATQNREAYGRNQNPATAPDPITGVPSDDISGPRIGNVYSNGTLMPEEMAAAQRSQQANAATGQALGWGQAGQGPMRGQYVDSTVSQLLQAEPVEQTISFEDDMGSKTIKIGEDGQAVITRKITYSDGSTETRKTKTKQLQEDELARLRAAPGEPPAAPAAPKQPIFAPGADRPSTYGVPNQHDPYASLRAGEQKVLTPELAQEFLKLAGGDKEMARKLAREAGYEF